MNIRFLLVFTLVLFSFSFIVFAGEQAKIDNFKLNDYNGKEHNLTDYSNSKAIVIMFIATQCPISNDYNSRMVDIYKDYADKGVTFLGINSNKQESTKEIKEHAKENGFKFTILKDVNNLIADKFEASFTPEIYVLSPSFEILYHGRIDDSRKENKVENRDLRNALDEILSGKLVTVTETKAFGCTIKRVDKK